MSPLLSIYPLLFAPLFLFSPLFPLLFPSSYFPLVITIHASAIAIAPPTYSAGDVIPASDLQGLPVPRLLTLGHTFFVPSFCLSFIDFLTTLLILKLKKNIFSRHYILSSFRSPVLVIYKFVLIFYELINYPFNSQSYILYFYQLLYTLFIHLSSFSYF